MILYELVIAPIADVCPGIFRLRPLPIDALSGDTVGIVAIGGSCVDELCNHIGAKAGYGCTESFPVLKNVPPVPLVVEALIAFAVFNVDSEAIPGSRGITMASAEGEWQILPAKPLEL